MIFNDLLFILSVCGDVHMSAAAQRPEVPSRLELESEGGQLLAVDVGTELGSSRRARSLQH